MCYWTKLLLPAPGHEASGFLLLCSATCQFQSTRLSEKAVLAASLEPCYCSILSDIMHSSLTVLVCADMAGMKFLLQVLLSIQKASRTLQKVLKLEAYWTSYS